MDVVPSSSSPDGTSCAPEPPPSSSRSSSSPESLASHRPGSLLRPRSRPPRQPGGHPIWTPAALRPSSAATTTTTSVALECYLCNLVVTGGDLLIFDDMHAVASPGPGPSHLRLADGFGDRQVPFTERLRCYEFKRKPSSCMTTAKCPERSTPSRPSTTMASVPLPSPWNRRDHQVNDYFLSEMCTTTSSTDAEYHYFRLLPSTKLEPPRMHALKFRLCCEV